MTRQYLATLWNQYEQKLHSSLQTPQRDKLSTPPPPNKISTVKRRVAAGFETKEGEKTKICWWEREQKKKRGGLLSEGHFGCHLSPWRRGPGPQKPLGRTDCLRGARYFLQHHLSLSPHNDSPRSSLLMFVIALSHKGGMINGAERSIEGSGDAGLLFVHLMQPGSHYLQPLCVQAK